MAIYMTSFSILVLVLRCIVAHVVAPWPTRRVVPVDRHLHGMVHLGGGLIYVRTTLGKSTTHSIQNYNFLIFDPKFVIFEEHLLI
jgi:hypothetical protein